MFAGVCDDVGGSSVATGGLAGQQTTLLVRDGPPVSGPSWTVSPPGLEDLVLAYMSQPAGHVPDHRASRRPTLGVPR